MASKEERIYARISCIEFVNFRNIESGKIVFPNSKPMEFMEGAPSILGLYGQNGSGKTSVIMALGILKQVLSGRKLGQQYSSSVQVGKDKCTLKYSISMYDDSAKLYDVYYEFDIRKDFAELETDSSDTNDDINISKDEPTKSEILYVENERLQYRLRSEDGHVVEGIQDIIDTRNEKSKEKGIVFGNNAKYKLLTKNNPEIQKQLAESRILAHSHSQSFIFCASSIKVLLRENHENECGLILFALRTFGNAYLHVVDTITTGITNINVELPLMLWSDHGGRVSIFNSALRMNEPTKIPEEIYPNVKQSLDSLNEVISKIIPDMSLDFIDCGTSMSKSSVEVRLLEVMSVRGNNTIPLKYESDGVRRIVSILSLLIAVYNQPSMTIAIDEIDSGIFEYLLGEILQIMSESGKGQLIFTSHNLRPLELLPPDFLCFTTVNPANRFRTMVNKGNSNMRDGYFRSIVLGSDGDPIYNHTDKYNIEVAFCSSGRSEE